MKIRIDGETYTWDGEDNLSLDEAIALERATGLSIEDFEKGLADRGLSTVKALIWIMMQRAKKDITLDDVGKLTFQQMEFLDDDDGAVTNAAGKARNRAARRARANGQGKGRGKGRKKR